MMLGGGGWGVGFMALGNDTNITSSVKNGEEIFRHPASRLKERRNSLPGVALAKTGVRRCPCEANEVSEALSIVTPWAGRTRFAPPPMGSQ